MSESDIPVIAPSPQVEVVGQSSSPSPTLSFSASLHSGPLPDPASFAAYDRILPGAANRILVMAEENQHMRRDGMTAAIQHESRRQIFAAVIAGSVLILTFLIILLNRDPKAYVVLLIEALVLAGAYVQSKKSESEQIDHSEDSSD